MAASSSTALVALCSSLTTQCKISKSQNHPLSRTLCLSKPNFGSISNTTKKLSSPLIFSKRPTFFARPKVSESEAPVVEAETEVPVSEANPEPAATQIVEVAKEEPTKREEIFAVVMVSIEWELKFLFWHFKFLFLIDIDVFGLILCAQMGFLFCFCLCNFMVS